MDLYQSLVLIRGLKQGDVFLLTSGQSYKVVASDPLKEAQQHDKSLLFRTTDEQTVRASILKVKDWLVQEQAQFYPALVVKVAELKHRRVYQSKTRRQFAGIIQQLLAKKEIACPSSS